MPSFAKQPLLYILASVFALLSLLGTAAVLIGANLGDAVFAVLIVFCFFLVILGLVFQ